MAQIIKHRRGSLEKLSEVTGSLQKGEIVIATGSANLSTTNGSALAFIVPESGSVQASNRFLMGSSDPAVFSASIYNGMVKGVPYYASGSHTLFLLGSDGNEAINLVGNIQPFSGSVNTRLGDLEASIGGGGSGIGSRVDALEASQSYFDGTFSGSVATQFSASIASQTALSASIATTDSASAASVSALSASIATTDSASAAYAASQLNSLSSSVATSFSASAASVSSLSASIATTDSASAAYAASQLNSLSSSVATSFSASYATITENSSSTATSISASNYNITSLSASVASVTGDFSSSVATSFSASAATVAANSASAATALNNVSSSVATSFSASAASVASLSASIATTDSASAAAVAALSTSVDSRLDSLEFNDTRFATTGSNTFFGTQVITGSMYITNDLIVQGSSSLQNITASAVTIGTNTVVLNTATPAVRFGGISVADSGSGAGASGSLFWDSLNNNWIYQHPVGGAESAMSAVLISGPKNSGSLGDEVHITPGKIMVAVGDDHIGDSIMSQSNGKITIEGGLDVTGNISSSTITGIGNVTLYSQSVDSRVATLETSLGGGGSVGTRVANLETISASYLSFTQSYYSDSSSFDTRISASNYTISANSASAATSFSASVASQTALSASIATTNNTQSDNIATVSASAWGAFQSASSYSSSLATSISASKAEYTSFSASAASDFNTLSGSAYTQFSASAATATANSSSAATSFSASLATILANSASAASDFNTLSGSTYTQFSASVATATANSASAATSISASNAEIAALSSSVASVTGNFSSSVATSFSASAASVTALSASIATTDSASNAYTTNVSASFATQFSSSYALVSNNSASAASALNGLSSSVATSFSASAAGETALSSSLASRVSTLEGSGSIQSVGTANTVSFAELSTAGNVTVGGDLIVNGNTTALNTANLYVEDKLITLASGSTSGTTSDGAGIEIAGTSASLKYVNGSTSFSSSVSFIAPQVTASLNVPGGSSTKRIAFRNTNDNIDFVAAPTQSGDLVQWNGTDFVMSNVIDGGAF